eukprot:m.616402 g.616402  ORF g.616402 m.616402 type:complete len:99 (+) comp22513_c2_seq2:152-448(+)
MGTHGVVQIRAVLDKPFVLHKHMGEGLEQNRHNAYVCLIVHGAFVRSPSPVSSHALWLQLSCYVVFDNSPTSVSWCTTVGETWSIPTDPLTELLGTTI